MEFTSSVITLPLAVGQPELSKVEGLLSRTPSYVNFCLFLPLSFPASLFGLCSALSFTIPIH